MTMSSMPVMPVTATDSRESGVSAAAAGQAGGARTNVVLKTERLSKRYGNLMAVDNLTLEVHEGEVFGLLGPNGAGKTTSIQMICGLLPPDSGRVLIHGQPMTAADSTSRTRVGMCPQSIVVWERLTCLEQLLFIGQMYGLSAAEARRRGERLLEELDLTEKRHKQARTLSGGMQRRLNIALALVHEPEIVVLDEPEAGLDPQSRVKVREYVQSLARKKTVIVTTHNMDEAERVADRVAIIDHGKLLVLDTPQALKRRLGEGDVVEIALENSQPAATTPALADAIREKACAALAEITSDITYEASAHTLRVHALNAAGRLAEIVERLAASGLKPGPLSIRANTLEDVFIQLTGRRLRE